MDFYVRSQNTLPPGQDGSCQCRENNVHHPRRHEASGFLRSISGQVTTRSRWILSVQRKQRSSPAKAGGKWISTFDLRTGYHQVKMDPVSAEKTTFITREGTFKFKIMPFGRIGRTGAPATFQRLMAMVMAGLNLKICLVYLDDIIVFSSEVSEHLRRLRAIFERLRSARLN